MISNNLALFGEGFLGLKCPHLVWVLKKGRKCLCTDLEIVSEVDLTIVAIRYQGMRSFKRHLEKQYSKGSQLDIMHIQLQVEQNPAVLTVMKMGSCVG